MLWRRIRFALRWLIPSDTNGNDPARPASFDDWWCGWKPQIPTSVDKSYFLEAEDNVHKFLNIKDLCEASWLAARGRYRFKKVPWRKRTYGAVQEAAGQVARALASEAEKAEQPLDDEPASSDA